MTMIVLTKGRIIRAIEKESKLKQGYWIASENVDGAEQKDCCVCAVGAVMRDALAKAATVRDIDLACSASVAFSGDDIYGKGIYDKDELAEAKLLLKRGSPMMAISHLFETTRGSVKYARSRVIRFIKSHFPAKITIDIHHAKPARDVRVVDPTHRLSR